MYDATGLGPPEDQQIERRRRRRNRIAREPADNRTRQSLVRTTHTTHNTRDTTRHVRVEVHEAQRHEGGHVPIALHAKEAVVGLLAMVDLRRVILPEPPSE